jgi:hypothetical protein
MAGPGARPASSARPSQLDRRRAVARRKPPLVRACAEASVGCRPCLPVPCPPVGARRGCSDPRPVQPQDGGGVHTGGGGPRSRGRVGTSTNASWTVDLVRRACASGECASRAWGWSQWSSWGRAGPSGGRHTRAPSILRAFAPVECQFHTHTFALFYPRSDAVRPPALPYNRLVHTVVARMIAEVFQARALVRIFASLPYK